MLEGQDREHALQSQMPCEVKMENPSCWAGNDGDGAAGLSSSEEFHSILMCSMLMVVDHTLFNRELREYDDFRIVDDDGVLIRILAGVWKRQRRNR